LAELPRSVVLVEGTSDEVAVETLAEQRGVSLVAERVEIVPIGGAHAIGRFLAHFGPLGVPLAGLYDEAEEHAFARALGDDLEARGFFACDPDLEGELIRALGADAVEAVAEAHGELNAFRTLQKQPAWRGQPVEEQLRRFMGSGGSRKIRYARLLVEALGPDAPPAPLDRVLDRALSDGRG
jgi:OLD-like protein